MEGTLYKLGGFTKNSFQKRHFILKNSRLAWYKKKGDSKAQGGFSVKGATVSKFNGMKYNRQNVFSIQPASGKSLKDNKSYVLAADSSQIRNQWIEQMQGAQGKDKLTIREVGGGQKAAKGGSPAVQKKGDCKRCNNQLGTKVVKVSDTIKYHRECFNCQTCGVDLITGYQLHDDEIHCVPCKTKLTKAAIAKTQKTAKKGGGGGGGNKASPGSSKGHGGREPKWKECYRCHGPCKPGFLVHDRQYCDECHTLFDKHGGCDGCGELCDGNYLKIGFDYRFHPECFKCKVCERDLSGISYKIHKQKVYCLEDAPKVEKKMYREKKKDFKTHVDWTQALNKSEAGEKLKKKQSKYECDYDGVKKPASRSPKTKPASASPGKKKKSKNVLSPVWNQKRSW